MELVILLFVVLAVACWPPLPEMAVMLDVPVPSIPVLRARLDSIRSGGAS